MTVAAARARTQRKADAIARLEEAGADVWVATASPSGDAHLVPLSYAWDGEHVVLAVLFESITERNARASGRLRLGFGPTRDVVLVDCALDRVLDARSPDADDVASRYASQADWDPRLEPEAYRYLVLLPRRIQAWREANELEGRLLMRDGMWLV